MAAVVLIGGVDVGRVEGLAHLLHPVFGADSDIDAHFEGFIDERVGEVLGSGVEAYSISMVGHYRVDVLPERMHFVAFEA